MRVAILQRINEFENDGTDMGAKLRCTFNLAETRESLNDSYHARLTWPLWIQQLIDH